MFLDVCIAWAWVKYNFQALLYFVKHGQFKANFLFISPSSSWSIAPAVCTVAMVQKLQQPMLHEYWGDRDTVLVSVYSSIYPPFSVNSSPVCYPILLYFTCNELNSVIVFCYLKLTLLCFFLAPRFVLFFNSLTLLVINNYILFILHWNLMLSHFIHCPKQDVLAPFPKKLLLRQISSDSLSLTNRRFKQ